MGKVLATHVRVSLRTHVSWMYLHPSTSRAMADNNFTDTWRLANLAYIVVTQRPCLKQGGRLGGRFTHMDCGVMCMSHKIF